jgi:group I intron endonuclease
MRIYRRTNTVNGKVYIGKTTQPVDVRWQQMLSEVRGGARAPIYNAIRKYGAAAFKTDILYTAQTLHELSRMETFFIILHQSHKTENGYNLTLGGDGASPGALNPMWGKTHTDEVKAKLRGLRLGTRQTEATKRKISESERGDKNPFFGKTHSEENRRLYAENAHKQMLGTKRSEETKRKMSLAALGVPKSLAHCAAISAAKKGKPGRVPSVAGIERIREAKLQWWAARRGART